MWVGLLVGEIAHIMNIWRAWGDGMVLGAVGIQCNESLPTHFGKAYLTHLAVVSG